MMMPLPIPFATESTIAAVTNQTNAVGRSCVNARQQMSEREADHRRHHRPQTAEAVHDPTARIEQGEVDGSRDADHERRLHVADPDAHGPEREQHLAAGADRADQGSSAPDPQQDAAVGDDRGQETGALLLGLELALGQLAMADADAADGAEGRLRIREQEQHDRCSDRGDDRDDERHRRDPGELDHARR